MSSEQCIEELSNIAKDSELQMRAQKYGLQIYSVAWEDVARNKNSCFGPNISDMTLVTKSRLMPMIRYPNFADKTADMDVREFNLRVGNECGADSLEFVSLTDYLTKLEKYTNGKGNVFIERDRTVLTSAQYCVVPENECFSPQIFSYQSSSSHPAVLVILASQTGTSAQVITERNQKIYFNNNGRAYDFLAKRLSTDRAERKVNIKGSMTADEQERNALMIFQIPLKIPTFRRRCGLKGKKGEEIYAECESLDEYESCDLFECKRAKGIEDAVLSLGQENGAFLGLKGLNLERDTDYPIRLTLQFYQTSDTKEISPAVFQHMAQQLNNVYATGKTQGSLVVGNQDTTRETQPNLSDVDKTANLTQIAIEKSQKSGMLFGIFQKLREPTPSG